MQHGLGPHLMLDLFGCPRENLADIDFVTMVLDTFPEKIGLTKLMPPHVFKYKSHETNDWGVSGVVLVADAHISIHTFPESQHAFIDIFSTTDFDTATAKQQLLDLFESDHHEHTMLSQGNVQAAKKKLAASHSLVH